MIDEGTAIWLYGSCARGDYDERSDVDLLHIGAAGSTNEFLNLLAPADRMTVSYYSWDQIVRMATYGSLFLHHLRLEGRPVAEGSRAGGRFRAILDGLPRYQRVKQDLYVYRKAVADVRTSLEYGGSIPFELAVLATTLRHAAVLGCYLNGTPDFRRHSAIEKYTDVAGLNEWTSERIRFLVDYKLWNEGRAPAPGHAALESRATSLCENVQAVITRVTEDAQCMGFLSF